ncbi:MAG: MvdC/MvdD family ATP grasp protein [Candidatus Hodarchaeales archaeon]
MILIITNKEDFTSDHVIVELHKQNIPFFRMNTEDYPFNSNIVYYHKDIEKRYYYINNKKINFSDVHSIWYRRPKKPFVEDIPKEQEKFIESETRNMFSGLWRTIDCTWVSHPDNIRKASSKVDQLYFAKKIGFNIPDTLLTNDPFEARDFYNKLEKKMIIKPINKNYVSTDTGEKIIFTNIISESDLENFDQIQYCPVLLQQLIPKKYDIRVNIFGDKVFATEIHSQDNRYNTKIDWRRGIMDPLIHKEHNLPEIIHNHCLSLIEHYKLNFGAIDLILSPDGKYHFLEINPNGQWAWIEPLTGQPLTKALIDLLEGKTND